MFTWITQLLDQLGYAGIALLTLLENVFPPIPSELIMPLAGFNAQRGDMNIWLVILSGRVAWTTILAVAGYLLAGQYRIVQGYLNPVSDVIVAGIAVSYIYRVATWGSE